MNDLRFSVPQGPILPVREVDVRLAAGPHPFEAGREEAIRLNWAEEKRRQPAVFDGEIMLLSELACAGERLVGTCHLVRYSTFLLWRRLRPVPGAGHAFAHPALVSKDNALVAIRMGQKTVNAGRIYFAAGSFEPMDFRDGRVDLEFNMAREVREETGIDIAGLPHDDLYHVHSSVAGTAIFRRCFLPFTADEAARRIAAFVAAEAEPEIDGAVILRDAENLPDNMGPQMAPIVRWHFGREEQGQG